MRRLALALAILAAAPAMAQPAKPKNDVETVIVTGEKTPNVIAHDFVRSYALPTVKGGKITRWDSRRNPLCPGTVGLAPSVNAFMTARIREIALTVGAPLGAKDKCKINMTVIVTSTPQVLLTSIRADHEDLLGYFQSPSEGDRLAKFDHPVEARYETATEDVNGTIMPDVFSDPHCPTVFDCPYYVTGLHARNGLISELYRVTIIAEADKITGYQLGALADYFAMLALSQTTNFDACPEVPSITTLISPGCPTSGLVNAITPTDLAYLRGVYKMDAGASLLTQQTTISSEIAAAMGGE